MSRYPDGLGEWGTGFPGSGAAAWVTPARPSAVPPAAEGVRGAVSRRALRHGLVVAPGRRERAKREQSAEWRRQVIDAIRAPSLKSGVITLGSGFGGTGKTDVAGTLPAIYAAAPPPHRVLLAATHDAKPPPPITPPRAPTATPPPPPP